MGNCASARARAAVKNETEAGHARAKAEASHTRAKAGVDIALSLPAEYGDEKNDTRAEYTTHSAQPAAERWWSTRRNNPHSTRGLRSQCAVCPLKFGEWQLTQDPKITTTPRVSACSRLPAGLSVRFP